MILTSLASLQYFSFIVCMFLATDTKESKDTDKKEEKKERFDAKALAKVFKTCYAWQGLYKT